MSADFRQRVERFIPLLLIVAVLVAAIASITPWPVGAYEDDAIYTLLAKALANGDGYRMINLPGAPHATHYPPGYPFLLSLLWRVAPDFPDNVVVFKFANAALLAVAAGGLYWFVRARLEFGVIGAALVAAVGTASIMTLHLAGLVLSEPLFLALLFLALPSIERSADEGRMRDAILAGLLLGVLAMVRTIGAVAIGSMVLVLLARRRPLAAVAVVAGSAVFLMPWQLWIGAYQGEVAPILMGKYGAYGPWMADGYREGGLSFARDVMIQNFAGMGNSLSYVLMPVPHRWPRILSLLALAPLVIGGLVVLARRAPVLAGFFTLYAGVIIVWPFHPHRFLIALWPMLVLVVAVAVRALWRWNAERPVWRAMRVAGFATLAVLAVGHAAYNREGYAEQTWADLQRRAGESAKPLVEWVARYTQPDDVLSTEHDVVVYLYTGRRGVPTTTFLARQHVAPFTPDEVEHWVGTMVDTFQPRYFVTGWAQHLRAADSLAARTPPVLRKLGAIPNHVVYERVME
jgi:hypothetical protein